MSNHVYKTVELVGSSDNGIEAAIQNAVGRAHETIRNIRWFEVKQVRGHVEDGRVAHYQVSISLGFTLDD